jgi:hypothetical protein
VPAQRETFCRPSKRGLTETGVRFQTGGFVFVVGDAATRTSVRAADGAATELSCLFTTPAGDERIPGMRMQRLQQDKEQRNGGD